MPLNIFDIHTALKEESIQNAVSGWIFTNFHNRDSLTDELLSIPSDIVSTRRWIYIILTDGKEIKINHNIEPHSLDTLPASEKYSYTSQDELKTILDEIISRYGNRFFILSDENIPVISTVDGGFTTFLTKCGITLSSAAPLIQRCKSVLSHDQIESQERAESLLYQVVQETWALVRKHHADGTFFTEYELQQFIMNWFKNHDLVTDHAPIVAFGANAGNPHYEPSATESATIRKGDIIQLDIWAKERTADAIYADISWVGIYDTTVPENIAKCWNTLKKARDTVCTIIEKADDVCSITGSFLDENVRKVLIDAGYENAIKHRTGHSIDTECHGSGVNLDSLEFPDTRSLLEGSSFSVEPGLYFNEFGLRTEIDIYINNGRPVISGRKYRTCKLEIPQTDILTIL